MGAGNEENSHIRAPPSCSSVLLVVCRHVSLLACGLAPSCNLFTKLAVLRGHRGSEGDAHGHLATHKGDGAVLNPVCLAYLVHLGHHQFAARKRCVEPTQMCCNVHYSKVCCAHRSTANVIPCIVVGLLIKLLANTFLCHFNSIR